jgi:hypothetical protein
MTLLAQINPIMPKDVGEMHTMQLEHSKQICGISVHVKDRGVASVALRSLAIAAECLTNRREQEEVLQVFDKIKAETGWRVGFLHTELKEKWGWNNTDNMSTNSGGSSGTMQHSNLPTPQQQFQQFAPTTQSQQQSLAPPVAASGRPRLPSGILNPLMASADFSAQHHPYQSYYVAPSHPAQQNGWTF